MKSNLPKSLWVGFSLLAAVATLAGPLQRGDVPGDPVWVLHLDCDGLRPTTVGQYILGEMAKPENQAKLEAFQALFKLDLRTQLHGLTLYDTGTAPEDGVLLVYGDIDAQWLATLAQGAKDHQGTTHNQHDIHSWIDEKRHAKGGVRPRVYASIFGGRVVIFAQREAPVAAALDVLDKVNPSLAASGNFPQLGTPAAGNFIQSAARKIDLPDTDPHAAVFRLSKMIRLQLGETNQQVNLVLNLDANDENVAGQLASVMQGLVSLMKLQDKPEATKLAQAIAIRQDGAGVVLELNLPAADAVEMMKADAARKAKAGN